MAYISGNGGNFFTILCNSDDPEHIHNTGCLSEPVAISGFRIEFNSFTSDNSNNYSFDRYGNIMNDSLPSDYHEFLKHHESYDYYDEISRTLALGYSVHYEWLKTRREYLLWKSYPDRPFLRPGRRIHQGTVVDIKVNYDRFGIVRTTTLELLDHNLLVLRMPKSANWNMGDFVEVAATVSVLKKPHVGEGHNPRIPKPSPNTGQELSVSDFLPS